MSIPILADKTGEIARRWGVMKDDEGIAFRGLFIVDPAGNLRQITINDMAVGRCIVRDPFHYKIMSIILSGTLGLWGFRVYRGVEAGFK